jgi:hypothetical protein
MINLQRQARDKHSESTQNRDCAFSAAGLLTILRWHLASWNARRHLEHSGLSWTSWWICCSLLCENALFEPSLIQNRSIYTLWRRLIDLPKYLFTKAGLWTKLRKKAFVPCCRTFSSICERHSGTLTDLGNKRKEKQFLVDHFLDVKMIILPRQARDKYMENTPKRPNSYLLLLLLLLQRESPKADRAALSPTMVYHRPDLLPSARPHAVRTHPRFNMSNIGLIMLDILDVSVSDTIMLILRTARSRYITGDGGGDGGGDGNRAVKTFRLLKMTKMLRVARIRKVRERKRAAFCWEPFYTQNDQFTYI